jgi:hypothetical protein
MTYDLAQKARDGRMIALSTLPVRRMRRSEILGADLLPELGPEQIGAVFASSRNHFAQNIFSV